MPDYTGTLQNGKVISVRSIDPVKTSMFIDFVKGYFKDPIKIENEDGSVTYRSKTAEEIETERIAAARNAALAKTSFTRIEIREAFRALNMEETLNSLLASNADFKLYWDENTGPIDLTHQFAITAMASFTAEQVAAIKLKIAKIS